MTNPHFMTVADAVRSSAGEFEAIVLEALHHATAQMSKEELREAFFPERQRGLIESCSDLQLAA